MWQTFKVWAFRKYYRIISARGWKGQLEVADWSAVEIPGEDGPIHARRFSHGDGADKPLIIYFHGGGWVIGDLDTHTPFCQVLSEKSGCTVISIAYRLAPEHPFPAAPRDCLAATRWIAEHAGDFGPSNHKLVLAGDSAGANLAACTCLELEPEARAAICGEVVIYPVADHYRVGFPSYTEKASGQALTAGFMFWFWDTYLGKHKPDSIQVQRAYPLRASNLGSLPPTFMVTAENDPLRDEGIALADKMREAGVALQYRHFDSAAHGFACSEGPNDNFNDMMQDLLQWLQQFWQAGAAQADSQ